MTLPSALALRCAAPVPVDAGMRDDLRIASDGSPVALLPRPSDGRRNDRCSIRRLAIRRAHDGRPVRDLERRARRGDRGAAEDGGHQHGGKQTSRGATDRPDEIATHGLHE